MCMERCPTPPSEAELLLTPAQSATDAPVLSGRLAVLRSGHHLADIAERLRGLEAVLIETEGAEAPSAEHLRRTRRDRLQAMDLILQELSGLSVLLVQLADFAVGSPDPAVDALVDGPRLQSLSQALRATGGAARSASPGIDLF